MLVASRAVPSSHACDHRQERLDELLARRTVAGGRGQHELPLASRRDDVDRLMVCVSRANGVLPAAR
jgi:hypothetical protein